MAEPMENNSNDYGQDAGNSLSNALDTMQQGADLAKQGHDFYNNMKSAQKAADAAKAAQSANTAGASAAGGIATGGGAAAGGTVTGGAIGAGAGATGGSTVGTGGVVATGTAATTASGPVLLIIILAVFALLVVAALVSKATTSSAVSNATISNIGYETYETTDPETGETVTRLRPSSEMTENQNNLVSKAVENVKKTIQDSYDDAASHAAADESMMNLLNKRITGLSGDNAFYYAGDADNAPKANTYDKDGNQRSFSCDFTPGDASYNADTQSGTIDSDYCHLTYSVGPSLDDEVQMMVAYAQSVTGLLGQYPSAVRQHGADAIGTDYDADETDVFNDDEWMQYVQNSGIDASDGSNIAELEQTYYANHGNEYSSIASDKFAKSLIESVGKNPFFTPADPSKWQINSTEVQKKYAAKYTVSHRVEETHTESYFDADPLSTSHGNLKHKTVTTSKWVEDDTLNTGVWESAEARSDALKNTDDTRYNIKQSYEYLYEIVDASVPIYYDISSYKEGELNNVQDYMLHRYLNESSADSKSSAEEVINTMAMDSMNTYWASYVGTYIDFAAITERLAPYFGEISADTVYAGADRDAITALAYGYDGTYSGPSISIVAESHGGSGSANYTITGDWATVASYCKQNGLYFMDHQCTDFVRYSAHQMYGIVTHGNGNEVVHYLVTEHPDMFVLSSTPAPGAIISIKRTSDDRSSPGYKYGHTAIVLSVDLDNDRMTTAEGNYGRAHAIVTRTVPISTYYPGLVTYAVPIQ